MDFLHIFRDSWKWTTKETLQNWSLPKHQAQWSRSLHILVSLYDVRFYSKQMFGWIWSIHSYHMFLVFIVVIVVILPFIFGLQKVCQRCSVGRALLAEGISGRFEAKISVANLRERDWFDWLGRLRCLRRKRCRGGRPWRRWSGNFKMRTRRFKCSSFDFRSVESDLMTPILSWKTFVSFKWTSLVSNLSSLVLSSVFIWTLFNCKLQRPEAPGKAINFQKRGTVVLCNIVWHCAVICFFMGKNERVGIAEPDFSSFRANRITVETSENQFSPFPFWLHYICHCLQFWWRYGCFKCFECFIHCIHWTVCHFTLFHGGSFDGSRVQNDPSLHWLHWLPRSSTPLFLGESRPWIDVKKKMAGKLCFESSSMKMILIFSCFLMIPLTWDVGVIISILYTLSSPAIRHGWISNCDE